MANRATKRKTRGAIVLGAQMAAAEEAERQHQATRKPAKSPMPKATYDYYRGDMDLHDPVQRPLDAKLAKLCHKFANADATSRQEMRNAITMGEFYTLLTFAHRVTVFAIRKRSSVWVRRGLAAVAMIDVLRVDWRDLLVALSLLHHAAERVKTRSASIFRWAATMANKGTAKLILGFLKRSDKRIDLHWGYQEIETEHGIGLIRGSGSDNRATNVKSMAFEIAAMFRKDKYHPEVELNVGIPWNWLDASDAVLYRVMEQCRHGATVVLNLRPKWHKNPYSQHVQVFLEEMKSPVAAVQLQGFAEKRRKKSGKYCALVLAEGNLFCLLVARSWMEGIKPYETAKSLERFRTPLISILRGHCVE